MEKLQLDVYEEFTKAIDKVSTSRGIEVLKYTMFYVTGGNMLDEILKEQALKPAQYKTIIMKHVSRNIGRFIYDSEYVSDYTDVGHIQREVLRAYNREIPLETLYEHVLYYLDDVDNVDLYIRDGLNEGRIQLEDVDGGVHPTLLTQPIVEMMPEIYGKDGKQLLGQKYLDYTTKLVQDKFYEILDRGGIQYDERLDAYINQSNILGYLHEAISEEKYSQEDMAYFLYENSKQNNLLLSTTYTEEDEKEIVRLITKYVNELEVDSGNKDTVIQVYVDDMIKRYPLTDVYWEMTDKEARLVDIDANVRAYIRYLFMSSKQYELMNYTGENGLRKYLYEVGKEKGNIVYVDNIMKEAERLDGYVPYMNESMTVEVTEEFQNQLYDLVQQHVVTYPKVISGGLVDEVYMDVTRGKEVRFTSEDVENQLKRNYAYYFTNYMETNNYTLNSKYIIESVISDIDSELSSEENYFDIPSFNTAYDEVHRWCGHAGIILDDSFETDLLTSSQLKRRFREIYTEYGIDNTPEQVLINEMYDIANRYIKDTFVTIYDKDILVRVLERNEEELTAKEKEYILKTMLSGDVLKYKQVKLYEHKYVDYMDIAVNALLQDMRNSEKKDTMKMPKVDDDVLRAIRSELLNNITDLENIYDFPIKRVAYHLNNLYGHYEKEGIELLVSAFEESLNIDEIDALLDNYASSETPLEEEVEGMLDYFRPLADKFIKPVELNDGDRYMLEMMITSNTLSTAGGEVMAKQSYDDLKQIITDDELLKIKENSKNREEYEKKLNDRVANYIESNLPERLVADKNEHFNPHSTSFPFRDKLSQLNNKIVRIGYVGTNGETTVKWVTRNQDIISKYISTRSDYYTTGYAPKGIEQYVKDNYGIDRTQGIVIPDGEEEDVREYSGEEDKTRQTILEKYNNEVSKLNESKVKGVRRIVSSYKEELRKEKKRRSRGGRRGMGYGGYGGYNRGRRGRLRKVRMGRNTVGLRRFVGATNMAIDGVNNVVGYGNSLQRGLLSNRDKKKRLDAIHEGYRTKAHEYIVEWNIALDDLYVKYDKEMNKKELSMSGASYKLLAVNKSTKYFSQITLRRLPEFYCKNSQEKLEALGERKAPTKPVTNTDVHRSTEDVYVMELLPNQLGEGQIIRINISRILEYIPQQQVSGWTSYEVDKDGWFHVVYGKDSHNSYYDKGEESATDGLSKLSKPRIDYEQGRKQYEEGLKQQQEDEENKKKQQEDEEKRLNETTSGNDNTQAILYYLRTKVIPEIPIRGYDRYLYHQLYKELHYRQSVGEQYTEMDRITGLNKVDSMHLITYVQGEHAYFVHPRFYINITENKVLIDRTHIVRIGRTQEGPAKTSEHVKVEQILIKYIGSQRKKMGEDYMQYDSQDFHRLTRLEKVLPTYLSTMHQVGVSVELQTHNAEQPHYRISICSQETSEVTTYVYAPSVLTTPTGMEVYYVREHTGSDLQELSKAVRKIVTNNKQYKVLMVWLSYIDLRKKLPNKK